MHKLTRPETIVYVAVTFYNNTIYKKIQPMLQYNNAA